MKVTAVVIDDNEGDRYLVRRLLKESGSVEKVLEFEDADQALPLFSSPEQFAKHCGPYPPPTLILLDINMPRMSGFELLEILASSSEYQFIYADQACIVMMFTSSNNPEDQARADQSQLVKDYIVKPLDESRLQEVLRSHFSIE